LNISKFADIYPKDVFCYTLRYFLKIEKICLYIRMYFLEKNSAYNKNRLFEKNAFKVEYFD